MLIAQNPVSHISFFFIFSKNFFYLKYSFLNYWFLMNKFFLFNNLLTFSRISHFVNKNKMSVIPIFNSFNKTLQLKKNQYYLLRLTNVFKLFVMRKKYSFMRLTRFTKFIKYTLLKKKQNISVLRIQTLLLMFKIQIVDFFPKFFWYNNRINSKTWHFLVGNLISPFYWNLTHSKRWMRKKISLTIAENRAKKTKKNRFRIFFRKRLKIYENNFFLRKLYIGNSIYFNKLSLSFRDLNYFAKLKFSGLKKKNLNWELTKPYLFLNTRVQTTRIFSNFLLYKIYKKYLKFFFLIKKLRFKFWKIRGSVFRSLSFKKKKFLQLRFRKYFFRFRSLRHRFSYFNFKKRNVIFNQKSIKKVRRLSIRLRRKLRFADRKHILRYLWLLTLRSRSKFKIKKKFRIRGKNRVKYARIRLKLKFKFKAKLTKLRINSALRNIKHSTMASWSDKTIHRAISARKKRKIKKISLWCTLKKNSLKSAKFRWTKRKFFLSNIHKNLVKYLPYSIKPKFTVFTYNWDRKKPFSFKQRAVTFLNKSSIRNWFLNFQKSLIWIKTKHPTFVSRRRVPFLLKKFGFIYLSEIWLPGVLNVHNTYSLKKALYSFAYKNEMHRYILKRYAKRRSFIDFYTGRTKLFFKPSKGIPGLKRIELSNFNTFLNTDNARNLLTKTSQFSYLLSKELPSSLNFFLKCQLTFWKNFTRNKWSDVNIKRVRFKPGYMTLWRGARQVLKLSLNLKMRYQYKLTKYLSKYNKFIKIKAFLTLELQLNNVLLRSRLLPDYGSVDLFIKNDLVFVNGLICANFLFQLCTGDLIQLIVTVKYYILYRWLSNWELKKKIRLRRISRKKFFSRRNSDEKQRSYLLPKWILFSKNTYTDISKYLEVDYFTLSAILLYEPFLWSEINPYNFIDVKFGVINLYNWKYIT